MFLFEEEIDAFSKKKCITIIEGKNMKFISIYDHDLININFLFKLIIGLLLLSDAFGQNTNLIDSLDIKVERNTYWWSGVVNHGAMMPLTDSYHADLKDNYGNHPTINAF